MPTAGSGTLQIVGASGKVSSDRYCDEHGLNCFDPVGLASGAVSGGGTTGYHAKFT